MESPGLCPGIFVLGVLMREFDEKSKGNSPQRRRGTEKKFFIILLSVSVPLW